ncbi:hypothetical protein GF252_24140 [Salmonella enterica subsp. salamae]|nr:Arc family DNA-binding protein [Salmonella enterica]EBW9496323.1 hypothetical protein [Salmonella enterica subsp. salamae serovar Sofia]ECF6856524.1 Arc family DNA-binding protein [Salmonella enterica subsp. arizonae]EDK4035480.1 hypothetical protein [Salmonella enterica subsp. salamae]EDQ2391761.1 Arc family DNA-binding protein [Salmonella enterica subsp. enterica]EDS7586645.1 Arc family DNA-binding protein [Salmonella enterica subsp. diarizonae]
MKVRDIAPYGVRLPAHLKEMLQESAKKNGRSLNSEIIFRLTESYLNDADSAKLLEAAQPGSFAAYAQETLKNLTCEKVPEFVEMMAKKIITDEFKEELKKAARDEAQKFIKSEKESKKPT